MENGKQKSSAISLILLPFAARANGSQGHTPAPPQKKNKKKTRRSLAASIFR